MISKTRTRTRYVLLLASLIGVVVLSALIVSRPDGGGIPNEADIGPNMSAEDAVGNRNGCPDSDGDCIPDAVDACPNTSEEAVVNWDGCPDADRDGVPDEVDECPNTPEFIPINQMGCSPDSDGDGVKDYTDECPYTLPGIGTGENGCAKCGQLLGAVKTVHFDFESAEIRSDAVPILFRVARVLKNSDTSVRIEGHANSFDYSLALSRERARVVSDYLIGRGVEPSRILAIVGKGDSDSIASDETEEEWAKNRRVEIIAECGDEKQ
uniref:OmpA-OmpF porin, OOP family n=1 Tax=Candidatus Kentrum sp. FW TaxID=2126338 RepID=A0A450TLJ3_9GAMM|nr:MAG: OmpA-OmpF porin, OOP family [Candidatus Kentron sp. FW]